MLVYGDIAVVKSSYFEKCLEKKRCIATRARIPKKYFFKGARLMELWEKHGYFFLVIISYGWLARNHPDAEKFHLKRLARILKEWKARAADEQFGVSYTGEIGVIMDYCSLYQAPYPQE